MKLTLKEKLIKNIKKTFTVTYMETGEGYMLDQTHFRIKELPNWLFAIWDITESLEYNNEVGKYPTNLWTFCEHNTLLDKFKRGRCYNDLPFDSTSEYLENIQSIIDDEVKHYYLASGLIEDLEYAKGLPMENTWVEEYREKATEEFNNLRR